MRSLAGNRLLKSYTIQSCPGQDAPWIWFVYGGKMADIEMFWQEHYILSLQLPSTHSQDIAWLNVFATCSLANGQASLPARCWIQTCPDFGKVKYPDVNLLSPAARLSKPFFANSFSTFMHAQLTRPVTNLCLGSSEPAGTTLALHLCCFSASLHAEQRTYAYEKSFASR